MGQFSHHPMLIVDAHILPLGYFVDRAITTQTKFGLGMQDADTRARGDQSFTTPCPVRCYHVGQSPFFALEFNLKGETVLMQILLKDSA